MDAYDSDSSLEDADNGVSTDVLLGYASEQPTDDTFSQLGGEPSWLEPSQHPSPTLVQCKICNGLMVLLLQLNGDLPNRFPEHERRLYVWACRKKACRRKLGSIRATRCIKTSRAGTTAKSQHDGVNVLSGATKTAPRTNFGESLFGGQVNATEASNPFASKPSGNPFSTTQNNPFLSAAAPNPFSTRSPSPSAAPDDQAQSYATEVSKAVDALPATFAAKASMKPTPSSENPSIAPKSSQVLLPWPERSKFPKCFRSYHLDAEYEYLTEPPAAQSESSQYAALMDVDGSSNPREAGGRGGRGEGEDSQLYESEHDKTFQHFADILSQNPDQVLRYEFGGSPLLYSRSDAVGRIFSTTKSDGHAPHVKVTTTGPVPPPKIPKCDKCGAPRLFEVQLMPHAIAELEEDENIATLLDDGMEWGTIIIAVCSKDCGSGDGSLEFLEEWAGVQWEEVVARGKGTGVG